MANLKRVFRMAELLIIDDGPELQYDIYATLHHFELQAVGLTMGTKPGFPTNRTTEMQAGRLEAA